MTRPGQGLLTFDTFGEVALRMIGLLCAPKGTDARPLCADSATSQMGGDAPSAHMDYALTWPAVLIPSGQGHRLKSRG